MHVSSTQLFASNPCPQAAIDFTDSLALLETHLAFKKDDAPIITLIGSRAEQAYLDEDSRIESDYDFVAAPNTVLEFVKANAACLQSIECHDYQNGGGGIKVSLRLCEGKSDVAVDFEVPTAPICSGAMLLEKMLLEKGKKIESFVKNSFPKMMQRLPIHIPNLSVLRLIKLSHLHVATSKWYSQVKQYGALVRHMADHSGCLGAADQKMAQLKLMRRYGCTVGVGDSAFRRMEKEKTLMEKEKKLFFARRRQECDHRTQSKSVVPCRLDNQENPCSTDNLELFWGEEPPAVDLRALFPRTLPAEWQRFGIAMDKLTVTQADVQEPWQVRG